MAKDKSAAYEKGKSDGQHGVSKNPYNPIWKERSEYREGNIRGREQKLNVEAED